MLVLGLNGWGEQSHDASAVLIHDGHVVAFAEEERFTRRKHAYDATPAHAARFCLQQGQVSLDDVDVVAFGWDIPAMLARHGRAAEPQAVALERLLPQALFPRLRDPHLEFVAHHIAHAASASLLSGDTEADVFVLDGQGEAESASIGQAVDGKVVLERTVPIGWSLGYFYEAACQYAGLRSHDAGKLMGLAAHGTVQNYLDDDVVLTSDGYSMPYVLQQAHSADGLDEQTLVLDAWKRRFEERVSRPVGAVDPYEMRDFAATVQALLERAAMGLITPVADANPHRRIHVAGGVGFNATLNGVLHRTFGNDRVFIQPIAGDAGVSLGAAAWVAAQAGDRVHAMAGTTAWGPEYTPSLMREALDAAGLAYCEPESLAFAVAELVASDQIVGWFQGRAEGGPRALGHRSLIARPRDVAMRDRINRDLKRRELWRPLAPSLTREFATTMFGEPIERPYMVVTDFVADECREHLGAVVHSDGSTRPQTVDADVQPLYHSMIDQVGALTGAAVVLNTSFNGKDEPVVSTPANAIESARTMGLDALALGPFLVTRVIA